MKSTIQFADFVIEATLDVHVDTAAIAQNDDGEPWVIPGERVAITLTTETQDPHKVKAALAALAQLAPATGEIT